MSETGWLEIVKLVLGFAGTVLTAVMAYLMLGIKRVGSETKKLVNSNMEVQLRLYAESTAREAAMTKDPGDIQRAVDAKAAHASHVAQQEAINAKK